jgi:tripeptidyl-peptidase-1
VSQMDSNRDSVSLIYPQDVTLYQVDDQIYGPEEDATINLFNTFLDALDGVGS